MANTTNLSLPLLEEAQAQKELTINEALELIDAAAAVAAAVSTSNTNGAGTATTFARADHTHAIGASSVDGTTLEVSGGAARIKDSGVSANKLATNAVTNTKIQDSAVTNTKIQDSAVTTAKVQDSAVSSIKIQDGAVTAAKIQDGAATIAKLANDAQDAVGGSPTLSAGAEVANARVVTVQCKDAAGNNLLERRLVRIWIGDSDFGGECAVAPNGGVTVNTGTLLQTVTAGKQLEVLSNTSGVAAVTLTESTVKTFYVMAAVASKVGSVATVFA